MPGLIDSHLDRLATAAGRARDAHNHRDALVRQLWAMGVNRRRIAEAAGMTRRNVYFIAQHKTDTEEDEHNE